MGGLATIVKHFGSMIVKGKDGKNVVWLWDYANERARLKEEMTKEEIAASEKAKYLNR